MCVYVYVSVPDAAQKLRYACSFRCCDFDTWSLVKIPCLSLAGSNMWIVETLHSMSDLSNTSRCDGIPFMQEYIGKHTRMQMLKRVLIHLTVDFNLHFFSYFDYIKFLLAGCGRLG